MISEKKSALCTGGSGFIGSHLCELLLSQGWHVTCVDNLSTGNPNNTSHLFSNPNYIELTGQFTNKKILKNLHKGLYDYVFHMAATASVPKTVAEPFLSNDNNVTQTLVLLETIRGADKKAKFVFSSSSSVYGNVEILPTTETQPKKPISPYALQKLIIEDYCRLYSSLYGLETVCLRYFNVYGPRQNGSGPYANVISSWMTNFQKKKECLMFGDGSQSRDFVYVMDVCEANLKAAQSTINMGETINIGSSEAVNIKTLRDLIEVQVPWFHVVERPERLGDVQHTLSDCSYAKDVLDWTAATPLQKGLLKTIIWYKENIK